MLVIRAADAGKGGGVPESPEQERTRGTSHSASPFVPYYRTIVQQSPASAGGKLVGSDIETPVGRG